LELHAHDLYDFCPRRLAIAYERGLPYAPEQSFPPTTLLTFRIGGVLEDLVKELLEGKSTKPMFLRVKDLYICGNPDFLVSVGGRYVVECKSIKKEDFVGLEEPLVPHKWQLQYYLLLGDLLKRDFDTSGGFVVYIPKQQTTEILKPFWVPKDPKIQKEYRLRLRQVVSVVKDGWFPPRTCKTQWGRAKKCPYVKLCFGEDANVDEQA